MSEIPETFEDAIRKYGWPDDIKTAAVNLSDTISLEREVSEQSMSLQVWQTMMIARALLAERERAAKMADDKAAEYEAETDMWPCAGPIAVRLRGLAEAIRA